MPKPDKYGSPFDPSNKRVRPQKPDRREESPRMIQVRGCGDPNCAECNPETAARGGRGGGGRPGTVRSFITDNTGEPISFEFNNAIDPRMIEDMRRAMEARMSERFRFAVTGEGGAAKPAKPSDPTQTKAYQEARKAVESWLIIPPDQAFDDIIGNDEALALLRDAIEAPVTHKDLYDAYGMKMPKGALLSGPPGCGKTMFARAAASEIKRLYGGKGEFICLSGAELQTPYVGETEAHIKALFTYAREYKAAHGHPLLIFIDEAEVLFPDRTGRTRRVAPWEESQVATFLAEMDGVQESGAFVLLATNRPEVIDQAVLRDGRCDFKITVKRPNMDAVEVILKRNFAGAVIREGTTHDMLVMTALEGLFDPHKIIVDAREIKIDMAEKSVTQGHHKHFLLEHIVSGAMATSIPSRAKRHAFARDKSGGVITGITVEDVIKAVNDLFVENRGLEHEFAFAEFRADFEAEARAMAEDINKNQPPPPPLQRVITRRGLRLA